MRAPLLQLLRCPFCGSLLRIEDGPSLEWREDMLQRGVLYCECCAFPVVAGIPYLRAGNITRRVLQLLKDQQFAAALHVLLGVDEARQKDWQRFEAQPQTATFRAALRLLSPTEEARYFLYRFSDPTFMASETVLESLAAHSAWNPGRVLDLGGGTGHLARGLGRWPGGSEVVLADLEFWKLWLAREFVAPECDAVCCDANAPLPFARGAFSLACCSDAMNYVWQRRLLAGELTRLLTSQGVLLVTHLHNALCDNPSAGMPLTPAGYRRLFETLPVRLFKESLALDATLGNGVVDFARDATDDELAEEPSLFALATNRTEWSAPNSPSPGARRKTPLHASSSSFVLEDHPASRTRTKDEAEDERGRRSSGRACQQTPPGRLAVNPLYQLEQAGPPQIWQRQFPSAAYEAEFAAAKRYLPERFELTAAQAAHLAGGQPDASLNTLAQCRALLELPERYG